MILTDQIKKWWRKLMRKPEPECPLYKDFREHGIPPLKLPDD